MLEKAEISPELGSSIKVMFNPAEYSLQTGVNYSNISVPGMDGPITQYISGQQDTLTVQLLFSTYQAPRFDPSQNKVVAVSDNQITDITKYTKKIYNLTKIIGALHRPPVCTFKWGSLRFKGVVTDVRQRFTMFLSSGKPVRAVVDVTFKSLINPLTSSKYAPFESPDRTKYRVLDESGSLWQLAYEEYGDADKWKVIAEANGIADPLGIKPGTEIRLPPVKM